MVHVFCQWDLSDDGGDATSKSEEETIYLRGPRINEGNLRTGSDALYISMGPGLRAVGLWVLATQERRR